MEQQYKIVEIDSEGNLGLRSVEPKEWYLKGGKKYGFRYEFSINQYAVLIDPDAPAKLGVTPAELAEWVSKMTPTAANIKRAW